MGDRMWNDNGVIGNIIILSIHPDNHNVNN